MSGKFARLAKVVCENSNSKRFEDARLEWDVSGGEYDRTGHVCYCGQQDIHYLFTIQNRENGAILYPIGSECIQKFEIDEMIYAVKVFHSEHRKKIREIKKKEKEEEELKRKYRLQMGILGQTKMTKGKYKGSTFNSVAKYDNEYIEFLKEVRMNGTINIEYTNLIEYAEYAKEYDLF